MSVRAVPDPEPDDAAKLAELVEHLRTLRQELGLRASWILVHQEDLQARAPGSIHTEKSAAAARAATSELEYMIAHLARFTEPTTTHETREG